MPRPVHFELMSDDPPRTVRFYESAFGWQITKWDGPMDYWMVATGEGELGINGGITRRTDAQGTVNTIGVDDLDAYLARVEAAGGRVVSPRQTVPGVGYLAYCADTDGTVFGLMQPDESAH